MTSCGLNGGPLIGKGTYEARIACNLWVKGHRTARVDGRGSKRQLKDHPAFTQTGKDREENGDQYISHMLEGACAGFKYFSFAGNESRILVKGKGTGHFRVTIDEAGEKEVARVKIGEEAALTVPAGVYPLYFTYEGGDAADFVSFTIR